MSLNVLAFFAHLGDEAITRVWPPVETAEVQPLGKIHDALADLLWASGCASLPVSG